MNNPYGWTSTDLPAEIECGTHPRLGRGAQLDYSADGESWWHPISFHANLPEARRAFACLPHHKDTTPAHYRILFHPLDTTEGGAK